MVASIPLNGSPQQRTGRDSCRWVKKTPPASRLGHPYGTECPSRVCDQLGIQENVDRDGLLVAQRRLSQSSAASVAGPAEYNMYNVFAFKVRRRQSVGDYTICRFGVSAIGRGFAGELQGVV